MTFELLGIKPEIVKALQDDGITTPTMIQEIAIPMIKSGNDVIGISNTGSGKTVAFGVPVLEKVHPKGGLQVLIMVPTRELAVQITGELKKFSRYLKLTIASVYGGVGIQPQIDRISRSEIVVGTTGRLLDHLQRGTIDLSSISVVILDEADKMVEMGFIEDIEQILGQMPKNKQVLLFGATISEEINNLKDRHMNSPLTAKAAAYVKDDYLEQYYYDVQPNEKFSLLVHLLKKQTEGKVMVFCATRSTVDFVNRNLNRAGIRSDAIHGKLSQNIRLKIMENFNRGTPRILVASAVAARGLDIRDVTLVINYGLSQDPQEYIHRIGRTARAGESGKAITLLEPRDHDAMREIFSRYRLNIKKLPQEQFERVAISVSPGGHRDQGGRNWGGSSRGRGRR